MSRVLFAPLGSLGDLHPVIALALEMRKRVHSIAFFTSPYSASNRRAGEVHPVGRSSIRFRCRASPYSFHINEPGRFTHQRVFDKGQKTYPGEIN